MLKKIVILSFFAYVYQLFSINAYAQKSAISSKQLIIWRADRPLAWNDFRGHRPIGRKWKDHDKKHNNYKLFAVTYSIVRYKWHKKVDDSILTNVVCLFDPKTSWKRNNKLSPNILKHEQTHFDISEVYARKTRQSFNKYTSSHLYSSFTSLKLHRIFKKQMKKRRRYQHEYDAAVKKAKNGRDVQEEWNNKVAAQLMELEGYKLK